MAAQMATETFTRRGRARWYPRWTAKALGGVVVLVALALVAVEVVWPLSAGLPLGWGQYQNSAYHLHIGTPAFWNVTADSDSFHGAVNDCGFIVVASPNTEPAPPSTLEAMLMPRWMSVATMNSPCGGVGSNPQASLWQPTGQRVVIAGQSAPIERDTVGAPQVSYYVSVTLHGYIYSFAFQDPTAAQAQRDLPDFLTFARSFRYVS
jgi:hypothetical protein